MNDQVSNSAELFKYNEFVLDIKRRDALLFRVGLVVFALILIVTSVTIYCWIVSVDQQMEAYQSNLTEGTKEIKLLREQIAEQEKNIEAYRSTVNVLSDNPIKTLIETSSEHRREIDTLKSKVQCILHNTDTSSCR